MKKKSNTPPSWVTRGKTIRELIEELNSFENQDLFVEISLDYGDTHKPISLVGKYGDLCLLVNSESHFQSGNHVATVQLNRTELRIINNALNEVCNGLDITEFSIRMGAKLSKAEELLSQINKQLEQMEHE